MMLIKLPREQEQESLLVVEQKRMLKVRNKRHIIDYGQMSLKIWKLNNIRRNSKPISAEINKI